MADALKRMYFGQPGTTNATLYTAPTTTSGSPVAVIRSIHVCNTTGTAATLSLSLNGTAATAANCFIKGFTIPVAGLLVENVNLVLESADTIQGLQGTSGALTVIISGVTL